MMWIIASLPFWLLGGVFLLGAFASIQWHERTTNDEAGQVFVGLLLAGLLFFIAAKVAS